jgi:hypothetical protein
LKKFGKIDVVSVGPAKEEKKDGKKEGKKWSVFATSASSPHLSGSPFRTTRSDLVTILLPSYSLAACTLEQAWFIPYGNLASHLHMYGYSSYKSDPFLIEI